MWESRPSEETMLYQCLCPKRSVLTLPANPYPLLCRQARFTNHDLGLYVQDSRFRVTPHLSNKSMLFIVFSITFWKMLHNFLIILPYKWNKYYHNRRYLTFILWIQKSVRCNSFELQIRFISFAQQNSIIYS